MRVIITTSVTLLLTLNLIAQTLIETNQKVVKYEVEGDGFPRQWLTNKAENNEGTIEWMAPPLIDGVHTSHHRTYGSRIRRFAIYLSNRSLHQLKLFCTFSKGYRFYWESVTQLAKINAPILNTWRILSSVLPYW